MRLPLFCSDYHRHSHSSLFSAFGLIRLLSCDCVSIRVGVPLERSGGELAIQRPSVAAAIPLRAADVSSSAPQVVEPAAPQQDVDEAATVAEENVQSLTARDKVSEPRACGPMQ